MSAVDIKINRNYSILQVGAIRVTYVALEHMSKLSGGRGGVIVNTASMAGKDHDVLHMCLFFSPIRNAKNVVFFSFLRL